MRKFNIIMLLLSLVFMVIGVINLSSFYVKESISGYTFHQYVFEVQIAFISYLIAIIVLSNLSFYTLRFRSVVRDERKRLSIESLGIGFLYIDIGFLILALGILWFILTDNSVKAFKFMGLNLYFYPIGIFVATLFAFASSLYLLLYGINEYYGGVSSKYNWIITILYILAGMISVLPNNYYGVITPPDVSDIRIFTNLLLFTYFLGVIILIVKKIIQRLKEIDDAFTRVRLKMVGGGFLLIVGFFIFYTLDALTSGGKPYTIWMLPAFVTLSISTILVYLGNLTPKWIEKKYK